MISECSKLVQKEHKTRHDWAGKVIHWELCKNLKFDQTNIWYMHKPKSALENQTHKLLTEAGIKAQVFEEQFQALKCFFYFQQPSTCIGIVFRAVIN